MHHGSSGYLLKSLWPNSNAFARFSLYPVLVEA
jgi:hypothetical protein